jgi:hypothetical protein
LFDNDRRQLTGLPEGRNIERQRRKRDGRSPKEISRAVHHRPTFPPVLLGGVVTIVMMRRKWICSLLQHLDVELL